MATSRFSADFLVSPDQFVSEHPAALFAYWTDKQGTRAYPAWTELELMDIHRTAPFIVVKDVIKDAEPFTIRYWGTGVTEAVGIDGTGKTTADLYAGAKRQHISNAFRMAVNDARPVHVIGPITAVTAKEHVAYEGVHLPLADAAGRLAHLISAYTFGIDFAHMPSD